MTLLLQSQYPGAISLQPQSYIAPGPLQMPHSSIESCSPQEILLITEKMPSNCPEPAPILNIGVYSICSIDFQILISKLFPTMAPGNIGPPNWDKSTE